MTGRIPLPSEGARGGEDSTTATATCYCGAVQLEVPTEGEGLVDTFVCHCTDCRKITASTFASNFIVLDSHLKHLRGEEKLTRYKQSKTIASGNAMENSFCSVCGTLMYRRSSGRPGVSVARTGTVDDFDLHETKLKPRFEVFAENKIGWVSSVEVEQSSNGSGAGEAALEEKHENDRHSLSQPETRRR